MGSGEHQFETERGFGTGLRAQLEKRRDGTGPADAETPVEQPSEPEVPVAVAEVAETVVDHGFEYAADAAELAALRAELEGAYRRE
jgi:hypothetical protein